VPVAADLDQPELDVVGPAGRRHEPARRPAGVDDERRPRVAGGELDEQRLDPVERLDRGRRVVDRRRQRADGDVDEHAERERRVLVDRPLAREHEHAPGQIPVGRGVPWPTRSTTRPALRYSPTIGATSTKPPVCSARRSSAARSIAAITAGGPECATSVAAGSLGGAATTSSTGSTRGWTSSITA
jgi:hypothetical protein